MMSWFSDKSHLWRCPLSKRYYDPRALMRTLCNVPPPLTTDHVRRVLSLPEVTPDGRGFSETQVEAAYEAFLGWYEGKGLTERSSPTSAPSTDSPLV